MKTNTTNRITRNDVARAAGVSTATVSNVLNQKPNVSEKKRGHVLRIIDELDYKPNLVARSLITNRTYHIVIVLDDITDPNHGAILQAFEKIATQEGYFLSICIRNTNKLSNMFKLLISRGIEGAFLMISPGKEEDHDAIPEIESLVESGIKVVTGFNCYYDLSRFSSIQFDFGEAIEQAVKHLVSLGHKDIGLLSIFPPDYEYDARYTAFIGAMKKYLDKDNPAVVFGQSPFPGHIDTGKQYTAQILAKHPELTAIIGTNDLLAVGAVSYLINNGYNVPEDVSVISIGDSFIVGSYKPSLTAMAMDYEGYGYEACKMLLNSIRNNSNHIASFKLRLVKRETTSPCRVRKNP
ncbi:MAG: LacI family DNA-binding transcriptional regulator [Saccharofermentanales bacterium]